MFSPSMPQEIKDNAAWLNSQKKLRIPAVDNHNFNKISERVYDYLFDKEKEYASPGLFFEMKMLFVHVLYTIIINFNQVAFNYFGCIACLFM